MAQLAIVLPITSKKNGIPLHIKISPPQGGVKEESYIKCEDIRSVSKERLTAKWGTVPDEIMAEVEKILSMLLGIKN